MSKDRSYKSKKNGGEEKKRSSTESSSSHSLPKPEFEIGEIIAGKWETQMVQIVEQLGSGGCGIVYRVNKLEKEYIDIILNANIAKLTTEDTVQPSICKNSNSSEKFTAALKAESTNPDDSRYHETLPVEAMVLRRLQWSPYACRLFMAGRLTPYVNVIVMTETGPSLSRLRRQCPEQRFSLSTAVRIGIQCINAIEDLHCIGFIHRDVKPSNFAIGLREEMRRIYLLDFGLSRAYLAWNEEGQVQHRRPRERAHFLGTERYCSPNVHGRIEQGRRDDMWSLFFSIIEMIRGKLPWRNAGCSTKVYTGKTRDLSFLLERCQPELRAFAAHIRGLEYESVPDYKYLRSCLETLCHRRNFHLDDPYDWEEGGRYKRYFKNFFA